ncbi:AraC family transcriptional regulator [Mycobacteroides abscessus]|uniref:AraC family transcriptional regulator n=1 Tax=Mycobacteroides abscessus TaxID=36809 RepID=UPI003743600F
MPATGALTDVTGAWRCCGGCTLNSIGDSARAVGFSGPSHFTTTFKNRLGVTPTAYRDSA